MRLILCLLASVLWTATCDAASARAIVRASLSQVRAERNSLPDLPPTPDGEVGDAQALLPTEYDAGEHGAQQQVQAVSTPLQDRLATLYADNAEAVNEVWESMPEEATLGEAVVEWYVRQAAECDAAMRAAAMEATGPITLGGDAGDILAALGEQLTPDAPEVHPFLEQIPQPENGTQILLFGFDGCVHCPLAYQQADELTALGWTVRHIDMEADPALSLDFGVTHAPTWVIFHDEQEVGRVAGPDSAKVWDIIRPFSSTNPEHVAQAVAGPSLNLGGLLIPYCGRTLTMGENARLIVPRDLSWDVEPMNGGGSRLVFAGVKPRAEVDRLVTWQVDVSGVEIMPDSITLNLAGVPDISLSLNWAMR